MEPTKKLAEFAWNLDFSSIPETVIEKMKLCTLDSLTNILGAQQLSMGRKAIEFISGSDESAEAPVVGISLRTYIPLRLMFSVRVLAENTSLSRPDAVSLTGRFNACLLCRRFSSSTYRSSHLSSIWCVFAERADFRNLTAMANLPYLCPPINKIFVTIPEPPAASTGKAIAQSFVFVYSFLTH